MTQKGLATARSVNRWLILVLLAAAQFMLTVDITVVNIALPSIQHAFSLNTVTLQWIVTAYVVPFGGFLLLGGRCADFFGRRRIFLSGLAVFTLASLGSGLANSGTLLILCRAIQGLAAAFMTPTALSLVLVTYTEGHGRNTALGVLSAVGAAGGSLGVVLGGIFTQYLGWQWNFYANIPIGVLVWILSLWLLEEPAPTAAQPRHLDVPGALLVTVGVMALVYALVQAPQIGWTSAWTLVPFAMGGLGVLAFLLNEARAGSPLMPLRIFRLRNVLAANLLMLLNTASTFATLYFATLYVQTILGYTPLVTGLDFLPFGVVCAAAATATSKLCKKVGYKRLLIVAPLVMGAGSGLVSFLPVVGSYWGNMAPGMLILFVGLGITSVSVTIAGTSGVAEQESGLVSGLLSTFQQVGTALGLAVITAVATFSTQQYMQGYRERNASVVAAATVYGFHIGYLIEAGLALLIAVCALLFIRSQTDQPKSEGRA
ncbi:MAG TPA: MFS transporter [Ktedonobacteraceae bacterium]|nr:MFS transporter [Ktedonobacteraceae bacterium]